MIASDSDGTSNASTDWEGLFLSQSLFLSRLQSICRTIQVEKYPLWFQTPDSPIAPATNYEIRQCTLQVAPNFLKPDRLFVIFLRASLL